MGTISYLKDWLRQRAQAVERPGVTVNAHGFSVGSAFVPWQSVAEIQAWKVDLITTDEAWIGFHAGGEWVAVSEQQRGFDELEAAMIAVFPDTAHWRESVLLPAFERNLTVLFRRR